MIQAIETEYKGYRFRSRLEARWAVFFDSLPSTPWEWRYETEGYKMGGYHYLPDFELVHKPGRNGYGEMVQRSTFIEVKSKILSPKEWNKTVAFSAFLERDVVILQGNISLDVETIWISPMQTDMPEYLIGTMAFPPFMCSNDFTWIQCDHCDVCDLSFGPDGPEAAQGCFYCKRGRYQTDTPVLQRAIAAARSARFEHGETPLLPH